MVSNEGGPGWTLRKVAGQLRALCVELGFVARVCAIALGALILGASFLENTSISFRVVCFGGLIAVGAVAYPRNLTYRRGLFVLGCAVLVSAVLVTERTTMWNYAPLGVVPESGMGSRLASWIRERDAVLTGVRVLRVFQGITSREAQDLAPAMNKAYDDMEASVGVVASPLLRSVLLGQFVGKPDTLVFNLSDSAPARGTVVFLHGTGGNWSLGCWLVARAAAKAHFRTVCPSAGALGLWGVDSNGVVRRTIEQVKASQQGPVVLAGLSSGAVGVGEIAPLLSDEIAGVAMLFGGHPAARRVSKPLLLLYGADDERFPVHIMRYVRNALSGPEQAPTVIEMLAADHMSFIKRAPEVEGIFGGWLARVFTAGSREFAPEERYPW